MQVDNRVSAHELTSTLSWTNLKDEELIELVRFVDLSALEQELLTRLIRVHDEMDALVREHGEKPKTVEQQLLYDIRQLELQLEGQRDLEP